MAVDRVLLEPHRVELGQELVGRGRSRARSQSPALGSSTSEQLRELVADPLGAHDLEPVRACSSIAATSSGIGLEAEAARRSAPARSMRSGSSPNETSGASGVRSTARREVGRAAERVDELGLGERERHRVDGEVAARQVGLDVVGERDLGLAALGAVDLGRGTS